MPMVKNASADTSCEAIWVEKGPLTPFAQIIIRKAAKKVPARAKYRVPFTWSVKGPAGNILANGFGRNYNQALVRATNARAYILENSVRVFHTPSNLSDRWEDMVAD